MANYRFERIDADIRRAFMPALTDRGFEKLSASAMLIARLFTRMMRVFSHWHTRIRPNFKKLKSRI